LDSAVSGRTSKLDLERPPFLFDGSWQPACDIDGPRATCERRRDAATALWYSQRFVEYQIHEADE
jgi:hypothetical protein